jgi:CubicO group peptidase (beta-lactamase class C family)
MRHVAILLACVQFACTSIRVQPAQALDVTAGFDADRLARIDGLVETAIRAGQLPGAVVLVGRGDRTVFAKAYGNRVVVPAVEPMTINTIFDIASLTKVVATTSSVMVLL